MHAQITNKVIMGDSELAKDSEWLKMNGIGGVIYCSDNDTIEDKVPIEFEYVDFPIPNHELLEEETRKCRDRLEKYVDEVLTQVNGSPKKTFICCPHGINAAPALVSVCFKDVPAEKIIGAYKKVVPWNNGTIGPLEKSAPNISHEAIVMRTNRANRGPRWGNARFHETK